MQEVIGVISDGADVEAPLRQGRGTRIAMKEIFKRGHQELARRWRRRRRHGAPVAQDLRKIAIVGSPNVGKSVLFNNFTGRYVTVSNYPGTTVEVSRGTARIGRHDYEVIDTPGMYSIFPITEEEKVARHILIAERPDVVIHVVDAKNMERMLPLTLQLIEARVGVILVLNMMDEAEKEGVEIDINQAEKELGIPVVPTVSTTGRGMPLLEERIIETSKGSVPEPHSPFRYSDMIEEALGKIKGLLHERYYISGRSLALLLIGGDEEIERLIRQGDGDASRQIGDIAGNLRALYAHPIEYELAVRQKEHATRIADKVMKSKEERIGIAERLSRLTMHPVTGLPILFLILYLGLYKFVGGFGAGTVVDFLEGTLFEQYINPFMTAVFEHLIPWAVLQDLFVGEYGLLTLGFRYAFAIILPLVTFFFLVFAIIEDTGYLPRLAMLLDRTFKKIGLSGRAVIPMVLGFACDTMATMVTRTLPTRRERVISTMLLALAVPCSAQLGVILALLEGNSKAMLIWAAVISLVFLFIGYLTAKVLPGKGPSFYMEVPPLRLPKLSNVLTKTYVRVKWYFKEVLPLFLAASFLIWVGQITHLFDAIIYLLRKPVALIGLPPEAAKIFLFGFFRRDYGAAGLYDLNKTSSLSGVQLVVACIALTLFLPCIAQFLMNVKERGWRTGFAISGFILFFSFAVAYVVYFILTTIGVTL
jgi:ferrous iron transport protein B